MLNRMPKLPTPVILSLIVVLTWSSIYFSGSYKTPSSFVKKLGNYDDIKNYDVIYPMDDSNVDVFNETFHNSTFGLSEPDVRIIAPAGKQLTDSLLLSMLYNSTLYIRNGSATEEFPAMTSSPEADTGFEDPYRFDYESRSLTTERNQNRTDDLIWMRSENLTVADKRNHVRKMMKHAWDNYAKYAWGFNELKPVAKKAHFGSVFGSASTGVTIIDSLVTLHTMGLTEEFKRGHDWVVDSLDINSLYSEFSVFEVNIRLVGGLLSCYALTGESVFKDKARQIADKLLVAFETPTGIPHSLVTFATGLSRNYAWASGGSSILSEIGTLHLEFAYLSDITGNPIYRNKTEHVRQLLYDLEKPYGLYPNYINANTGQWGSLHSSIGSLGDSFYEYLLKSWLQSNKEDTNARKMYDEAMAAILKQMLQISPGGLTYFAEHKYSSLEHRMEHLGCFIGGLLALGATTLKNNMTDRYLQVAKEITHTCHETYNRSYTKLGPEAFRFNNKTEAMALTESEDHYILRPEVVESYFYLYRLTKEKKYRDWGWEAVQALETYCRVDGGYTGISDVYTDHPEREDVQQSFFMSETLKYLYLLFSDDDVFSLDEWVFNTEAHPLPIKDVNPHYRAAA